MGSMDYVEVLRRRAVLFHEYAEEALSRGHFDLAVFHAEQALQLRLKSLLLRLMGYVPRTHGVRELFGMVSRFLVSLGRDELGGLLDGFVDSNREALRMLGEAYTASRYLPRIYEYEDASEALRVVEDAFKLLERVEKDVFGN